MNRLAWSKFSCLPLRQSSSKLVPKNLLKCQFAPNSSFLANNKEAALIQRKLSNPLKIPSANVGSWLWHRGWPNNVFDEFRRMEEEMMNAFNSFGAPMFRDSTTTASPRYVKQEDGSMKMLMDFNLRGYRPEEITITQEGPQVTVEAKQEEKSDAGSTTFSHFKYTFTLPENVKLEQLSSKLLQNGHLRLTAPCDPEKKTTHAIEDEKEIPIQRSIKG